MNKIKIHLLLAIALTANLIQGQKISRIGYVDISYVLENLEEYKIANEQFSQKVEQWQREFEEKAKEIEERKKTLDAEKALLTAEMIKDREEEIEVLQNSLDQLKEKRFGAENGDYITQRWQLIRPISDQIFNIAQEIGKTKKYNYIFTKEDVAQIYADEKQDLTKFVLRVMKRKDNEQDRNKDMATLLKEVYDYDLKDEKTRKKEAIRLQREADLAKRKAEAEKKKKQAIELREKRLEEQRLAKEKAIKEREEKKKEKKP